MKLRVSFFLSFLSSLCLAQYVPHAYSIDLDNFLEVYGGIHEWTAFLPVRRV